MLPDGALAAKGEDFPKASVKALKRKASPMKVLHLSWEGFLAVGSPGIPQSYIVQQTLHKRFTVREEPRRVAACLDEKQQETE